MDSCRLGCANGFMSKGIVESYDIYLPNCSIRPLRGSDLLQSTPTHPLQQRGSVKSEGGNKHLISALTRWGI